MGPGGETLNMKSEMFSKLALLDISGAQTLTKSEDGRQCVQEAENCRRSVRRLRLPSLSPPAAAGKSFHQGDLH